MNSIALGPFELEERIGRGGMGDVYRGRHVQQGIEVAIKVITARRAQESNYISAFKNEVHSMARLNHPGIVMVFDVGEISLASATQSRGDLQVGSPYVAMELATHGNLTRVRDGLHWGRLKATLYSILDALAHAHARGVIHRDLKPGNVLLTANEGKAPGVKLVDFGLAHAADRSERGPFEPRPLAGDSETDGWVIAGTPRYMAPEQIDGRWRDQGPWTDLYSVGCLAHFLVNGDPPFSGELEEILNGHLNRQPRPLQPDFDVPREFQAWAETLLAKRPLDRFRRAADAAYALLELDETHRTYFEGFGAGSLEEITDDVWIENTSDESHADGEVYHSRQAFSHAKSDLLHAPRPQTGRHSPTTQSIPMPETWRRPADRSPSSMKLVGAGLGLYGVRSIPVIARETERDKAWETLRDVRRSQQAHVLMLRGAPGNGKSRIAQWLCERAHETGAALVHRARHSRGQPVSHSLRRAMSSAFNAHGLTRDELEVRIRNLFLQQGSVDLRECHVLAQLCVPRQDDNSTDFISPTERFEAIRAFFKMQAAERPIVFWIDDAQWGSESLEFITYCNRFDTEFPILFVLTVRDDALKKSSLEHRLLSSIAALENTRTIEIDALPPEDHERLVRELLSLESDLAREVAQRTDGNPLFAVQLVGDWVQRGVLEVQSEGFSLSSDEEAPVPRSIRQVWRERITRVVQAYDVPANARIALEAAAVLGDEIETREWHETCQNLGLDAVPNDLVERLVESRLAMTTELGWSFNHGMLRETLLREIAETGVQTRYERACSKALSRIYPKSRQDVRERIAIHQLAAGEYSRALEPLLDAASWRNQTCDFDQTRRLLDHHQETLERLKIPESDERWGHNWLLRIASFLRQGILDEAESYVERGLQLAAEFEWRCHATFILHCATIERKKGNIDEAEYCFRKAHDLYRKYDLHGVGRCLYGVGEICIYRGDVEAAEDFFNRAAQFIPKNTEAHALLCNGKATVLTRKDDFEGARACLNEAVEAFEQLGNRNGMASALNAMGELDRMQKRWNDAARNYERSREILKSIGSRSAVIPTLNFGLMKIAAGNYESARSILEKGLKVLVKNGERDSLGLLYVALLPCAAAMDDWDAWDAYFRQARTALDESEAVDYDIREHAELAADIARKMGQHLRAQQASDIAHVQKLKLED